MKIYVMSGRRILSYFMVFFGAVLIFLSISFFSPQILQVFAGIATHIPIYSVDVPEKKIALTFDCAWGADDIESILDVLRKENVKATFFLVGEWVQKYPHKVRIIADSGHEIGNHSDTHPHMTELSPSKIKEEIRNASVKIQQVTGQKPILFRVPYGDYNDKVIHAVMEENVYCIQWDVDSLDWKDLPVEKICERVLKKVKNGSIILMHNDTKNTVAALPILIKALKEKGYTFVTVSQLIYKENYYIDFEGRQHQKKN